MKASTLSKILLIFLLISNASFISGQTDTEFWFVAPETTRDHDKQPGLLQVSTFEHNAHVTISMPANPTFQPIELLIPANSQIKHIFEDRVIENSDGTIAYEQMLWTIENGTMDDLEDDGYFFPNDWEGWTPGMPFNKGLFIASDQPVSVFYSVASQMNTETFNLKGQNALGYDFILPSQNIYENFINYPNAREKADIVATEDNTTITIELSENHGIEGHPAGSVFTLTLQKGQTYSLRSTSPLVYHHLGGTTITSNKPIAVTISDDSVNHMERTNNQARAWDLIGDQLLPIRSLGNEYIAMNTTYNYSPDQIDAPFDLQNRPFNTDQKVLILAATENENGTLININGEPMDILRRGESVIFDIIDNALHIKTDAPVYVYQFASFGYELGSAILQPIESINNRKFSFSKFNDDQFLIQILTKGEYTNDLRMISTSENIPINDLEWTPVYGTENSENETWYTAVKSFPGLTLAIGKSHTIESTDPSAHFHLSSIESTSTGAIFSNYPSQNTLKIIDPTKACQGDEVTLYTNQINKELRWYHESNPIVPFSESETVTVAESGEYWAETSDASYASSNHLNIEFSSITPTIHLQDVVGNHGESHTYTVDAGYSSYTWQNITTNQEIIPETPAEPHIIELSEPATISLTVTNEYSCPATDTFTFSWGVISSLNDAEENEQFSDLLVYPTPASGDIICFNKTISGAIYQIDGAIVLEFNNTNQLNISNIESGVYIIQSKNGQTAKLIKQ